MADFIFRVASGKLSPAHEKRIAAAIQGAVLTELGQLDLGGEPSPDMLYRPITWLGGLLIKAAELEAAENATLSVTTTKSQTQR